uniref:ARAD1C09812p n=1 Tax=Blastobotrys adeninivorans TaxID=409370 RepID=A0A060SZP1_BLAAD
MVEDASSALTNAIDILCHDYDNPESPNPDGPAQVDVLDDYIQNARAKGLTKLEMTRMVNLVTSKFVKRPVAMRIIREGLIPNCQVPSQCAIRIASCLNNSKVSMQIKAGLLRWLAMICQTNRLEAHSSGKSVIHCLYGLIFAALKYESCRQWVCHILYHSTTIRSLVKSWRIQYVIELYKKNQHSSYLLGLLAAYRRFAPEQVPEYLVPSSRAGIGAKLFKIPDQELDAVISSVFYHEQSTHDYRLAHKRNRLANKVGAPFPQSAVDPSGTGLALEDIQSLQQLVGNLHKLNYPLQMASVLNANSLLAAKMGAWMLALAPSSDDVWERLWNWVVEHGKSVWVLTRIQELMAFSKVPLPADVTEHILTGMLNEMIERHSSNALTINYGHLEASIDLLPFIYNHQREQLQKSIFEPLHEVLVNIVPDNYKDKMILRTIENLSITTSHAPHLGLLIAQFVARLSQTDSVSILDCALRFYEHHVKHLETESGNDLVKKCLACPISSVALRACALGSKLQDSNIRELCQQLKTDLKHYGQSDHLVTEAVKLKIKLRQESISSSSPWAIHVSDSVDTSDDRFDTHILDHLEEIGYSV